MVTIAAELPEAWEEVAFVTISKFAATDITLECAAMTETIDIAQGDYPGLYNLTRNMIKRTSACNVDFILTAHLEPEENKLTGEIRYVLYG